MKMDEKKSGRLQSLKLPRDLSLGLAKPKKQYAPNLNVVRNKDKPKEILKKNDQKRKSKTYDNKNDSRFVQSSSVFSQGAGEIRRINTQFEKRVSFREDKNSVVPSGNRKASKKSEDAAILSDLTNCDMDSDGEDEKMSFAPLTLALKKVKSELVIKKEDDDSLIPEPFNSDVYNEENPALGLIKLPDSFAGKGLSDDPNVKTLFDYGLSDMLEGQIGKLVIRKSGKMEAHIGRIKYELTSENTFDAKEELAIITNDESGGHIAILGNVLNNFIMFPDYESLLK